MNIKKTLASLLSLIALLCLTLTSCAPSGEKEPEKTDSAADTSASADATSESTEPESAVLRPTGENESGVFEEETASAAGNNSDLTNSNASAEQTSEKYDQTDLPQTSSDGKALVTLLQNSVDVLDVKTYSGRFIENGKVENVTNTLSVTLRNRGDDIQLLEFEVSDGETAYSFSATTLFKGAEVTVSAKNGETVPNGYKAKSIKVTRVAYFGSTPSLHPDIFELDCSAGIINVKNISDSDISDGYIYYKEYSDGEYFGGITYRIKTGEIKAGEIKQLSVPNFDPSVHKAVFITYGG